MFSQAQAAIHFFFLVGCLSFATGEEVVTTLTNLALGRQFEASSTCGLNGPEEYCYSESNGILIPDDCYMCDASSPLYSRGIDNINDEELLGVPLPTDDGLNLTLVDDNSTELNRTWWQSADGVNEVTVDLNFERGFDLYQVAIDFRSLRPASATLEASTDFGASYKPIQHYSDKCLEDFGIVADDNNNKPVETNDNVAAGCTSNYTSPSPGALLYEAYASPLATVTNIRLKLFRFNTPPEDIDLADELQHYAVYNFEVLGVCSCVQLDLVCVCEGEEDPLITTFPPQEACDLPGVTGPTCDTCLTGYYNYSESDGCQPCDCNIQGTLDSICNASTGLCYCADGVLGQTCDTCPSGSIGPSMFTHSRCTSCFCNGYSMSCESAEGWYQAQVESTSFDENGGQGFKSNGVTINDSSVFLEVEPSAISPHSVILSFPRDYLGDKRTAYNQRLSMVLSLPHLNKSQSSSFTACLEVVGQTVRYPQVRIIWPLKTDDLRPEPTLIEIPLVSGRADLVPYFSRRRGRLARTKDIREVLTDIRMMRLIISTKPDKNLDPLLLTVRLYTSSLSFAVNTLNSTFALQPIEPVSYVERCTDCPSTTTGEHCDECTAGHTIDPNNGGEFALCVECFCHFFSDTCHPMTGECLDCTGNTFGADCENCIEGYARAGPLALLPCDQCADGFWDPGNGTCISCSCNLAGSISNICDKSTGVCECKERIVGDLCDACANDTSQLFPSCEPCDECTEQWLRRIIPLGEQVQDTVEFVSSLNLSNETMPEIPLLEKLLELAGDIETVLSNSSIDLLTADVESFNARLCQLLNQTDDLIQRGADVQAELEQFEVESREIGMSLPILMNSLAQLRADFENVSMIFQSQNFLSVNTTFYVELAQRALERSDAADQLVQENVTSLANQTALTIEIFNATFDESRVVEINNQLQQAVSNVNSTVNQIQTFVSAASEQLCGMGSAICLECADESCEVCPSGIRCDGLIATADLASNTSARALAIAEDLLQQISAEVEAVDSLLERAYGVQRGSQEVSNFVSGIRNASLELDKNVRSLVRELEQELNSTRVDPEDIGRLENATLSLKLDLLPEEFFELLVEINTTIDAFFADSGVNEIDLRERLEAALKRAERANDLATEVATNATALRQNISEVIAEQMKLLASANQTTSLVEGAESALEQAQALLENTETSLNSSRDILMNVSDRLVALELQIDRNRADLGEARNLTSISQELADQVANDSVVVEGEFVEVRDEALIKLDQSERDLQAALDIRNRTQTVQQLAQQQLLDVEKFERTRDSLIMEQETIRSEVARVAMELENLESEIQKHITRNTGCLDSTVLSKRKRKRRSPKKSKKT